MLKKLVAAIVLTLGMVGFTASVAHAVPVIYSISFNGTLNNADGIWGGNLKIGAGQIVDLTLAYSYDSVPSSLNATVARFALTGLQVFDDTNGLASAVIGGSNLGRIIILYDGADDSDGSGTFGSPGGGFGFGAMGEFGELGDDLPFGPAFDAIINAGSLFSMIARAPSVFADNVGGVNGVNFISVGDFVFSSSGGSTTVALPEASTLALFGTGLLGLGLVTRRRRKSAPSKASEWM